MWLVETVDYIIHAIQLETNKVKKKIYHRVNKVWWQCLVPTSTTRFASDAGYRMAKM